VDIRFGRVKSIAQWHKPVFYANFFEVLEKELKRGKVDPDKEIFMSTMTDLYQPYAVKYGISTRLISMVQQAGLKYRILTKSPEVLLDIELHSGYEKGKVGLSITTNSQNEENRKYWEPRTVPILKRLEAMQKMDSYGGVDLWVSAEPFLPGTDFDEYFQEIISYGGDSLHEIIIGKMNYEAGVDKVFEWGSVVRTCEEYRHKYKDRIRFHYKKEFMHFLERKHLTPWDLGIAPKEEFCVSEHNGRK